MKITGTAQVITALSPTSATTAVHATLFKGSMLAKAEYLVVEAALSSASPGATGGPIDVYLQRKLADNEWVDWVHFPQLANNTSAKYTVTIDGAGSALTLVGGGTDAAPGVALAAGAVVNVTPGGDVRIVFVSGSGTSAGATNTIRIQPYTVRI